MAGDTGRSGSVYGGVAEPCTVVLFGASGDLAKRKVIPAMYDLAIHNALGPRYVIVGFARSPMSEEVFRTTLGDAARPISPSQVRISEPIRQASGKCVLGLIGTELTLIGDEQVKRLSHPRAQSDTDHAGSRCG